MRFRRSLSLLALGVALAAVDARAVTRAVVANGNWNAAPTWGAACGAAPSGGVPTPADDVVLCPSRTVTVPCGVTAFMHSLTDDPSWTSSSLGGLATVDGDTCAAGQVPKFSFNGTSPNGMGRLDGMGAMATFTLKGRNVIPDSAWGEPYDLTDDCGGPATINAITYTPSKLDCSVYTWANQPYAAIKPPLANLARGNLIWFTTGAHRNNWAIVVGASSSTVTIGFGDPGDSYGANAPGGGMPVIGGHSAKTSIETPMDVSASAFDRSNPTRIQVTIQTGALSALPGAASGTGQRAGSCLITSKTTSPAGSGRFYRIAGSIDGGPGQPDKLILDPWQSIDAADLDPAFLSLSPNAWIAPCVRPGDRWYAFEPVVWKPSVAGLHYDSILFVNGLCPTIERVWMPMITPAQTWESGSEPYIDMTQPSIGFYGQVGCTINGPWAIGPQREVAVQGYGMEVANTFGMTIKNTSMQGSYWDETSAIHGFSFYDDANLTFDGVNVSWINNEGFYHHSRLEEISESDRLFEGLTITIKNSTAHDLIQSVANGDRGSAIELSVNQTAGTFDADIHDNLIYNVDKNGIVVWGNGPQTLSARVYGNVIGPLHRDAEADLERRMGVNCSLIGGGSSPTVYVANNVLLSDIDYNGAAPDFSIAINNCAQAAYNYVGEWTFGINLQTQAPTGQGLHYGNLFEGAGAVSAANTTSAAWGIHVNRVDTWDASYTMQDNVFRRWCGIFPSPLARTLGLYLLGSGANANSLWKLKIADNTFGMFCPEASAAGNSPAADSAGIYAQGSAALKYPAAGSEIRNNLFVTGDPAVDAGDPFETIPMRLNAGLNAPASGNAGSLAIGQNVCSECDTAAGNCNAYQNTTPCCLDCGGSVYAHEANDLNLELMTPARPMESLGIVSSTDTRLVDNGEALAFTPGGGHAGAGYSGILSYSQAMKDAGVPPDWITQRATDSELPDRSVLPPALRFLAPGASQVICWGDACDGSATPPAAVDGTLGAATAIATGIGHGCAIAAGTDEVICWGDDSYGQATPPAPVDGTEGTAVAIAAGENHTCAIESSTRRVVCWGRNNTGQASPPAAVNGATGGATAIAAGAYHSCAIQAGTGNVVCWGSDFWGQAAPPAAVNGVAGTATAIAAGWGHSCAIQAQTGNAVCWGWDGIGQSSPPASVDGTSGTAQAIAIGLHFSCAIQAGSGAVACWGSDDAGQTQPPAAVDGTTGAASAIAAGSNFGCAIQAISKKVFCWGSNGAGQATPPATVDGTTGTATAITAGGTHALAIRLVPACADGTDNDDDGQIDFDGGASANGGVALALPDTVCSSAIGAAESRPPACGFGVELALLMPLLAALARRRQRAGPAPRGDT